MAKAPVWKDGHPVFVDGAPAFSENPCDCCGGNDPCASQCTPAVSSVFVRAYTNGIPNPFDPGRRWQITGSGLCHNIWQAAGGTLTATYNPATGATSITLVNSSGCTFQDTFAGGGCNAPYASLPYFSGSACAAGCTGGNVCTVVISP